MFTPAVWTICVLGLPLTFALQHCRGFICRRSSLEDLKQDIAGPHGGFEDLSRHEQYDFKASWYYQKIRTNSSSFTPPERLESPPSYCTPKILHSGLLKSPGAIYETQEGHYYFEPHDCRLRRLSGQQARQCLAGRHIDFLGDSVTRQRALSLSFCFAHQLLQGCNKMAKTCYIKSWYIGR